MRLLVYTDLQADEGSERLYSDPTVPLQRWRVAKFFKWLKAAADDLDCDGIVDLGDTVDSRNSISHPTIMTVMNGIAPFAKTRKSNFKLIGNHDQWTKSGDVHVGPMFEHVFTVEPSVSGRILASGSNLILASFDPDERRLAERIQEKLQISRDAGAKTTLLAHCQVVGARMNSGASLTGVPKEVVAGADVALLGHVHGHQQIGDNAWYVGSPFQQDFGEAHDEKFVALLDTESLDVEFIEVPGFPKYRVASLDEFERRVEDGSEDRWKVVLNTYEEAERLYAHPHAGRVIPSYVNSGQVYEGVDSADTVAGDVIGPISWTLETAIRRYMDTVPPESKGIEVSRDEVAEFAVAVTKR